MYTYLTLLFLLIILSTYPSIILSTCPSSSCSKSAPAVRFPFPLLSSNQPNTGYTGYNITCNSQALTLLTLPNSDDFYVRNIDYYLQQVILYDPENCMPKRFMNLDLSNSPFHINSSDYINFTILTCPTHIVQSRYTTVDCLSNATTSVLATTSVSSAGSVSNSCTIVNTVSVPIYQPYYLNDHQDVFSYDLLTQDLRLNWNISRCVSCEGAGGFCGLGYNQELGCYTNCQSGVGKVTITYISFTPHFPTYAQFVTLCGLMKFVSNISGPSPSEIRLFRLVILCFTVPAVAFTVGVAMYFWFLDHGRRELNQGLELHGQVHPASYTISSSSPSNGLDELTIESYAKVVVGESKRIPGPNDIACPICLVDYCPKDTLRSIPECKHCFHADCVDEWLRANPTCPLCRNSPSHPLPL